MNPEGAEALTASGDEDVALVADAAVAESERTPERLENERHHLLLDVAVKDAYIVELRGKVKANEERIATLEAELAALSGRAGDLQAAFDATKGELEWEKREHLGYVRHVETAVGELEARGAQSERRVAELEAILASTRYRMADAFARRVKRIPLLWRGLHAVRGAVDGARRR
jgi:predicted RNase H-like nuclease (RuvC/YqgF family)